MLYGLTERESNAKAPDWYGTEVVIACVEKIGICMSMCEVVAWKFRGVGGFVAVLVEAS